MAIGETRDTNLFEFYEQSFAFVPPLHVQQLIWQIKFDLRLLTAIGFIIFRLAIGTNTLHMQITCLPTSNCLFFKIFIWSEKTPQVPPVGLVSTRAGRQKKNAQHAGHLHNTSAWPSEFSPFRRPPVVIHAATIDWHRIGLLLAATSRNVHNGHLICIRISSLRITWRFDCF